MIYDDVMELFSNENALKEFPLHISLQDEIVFDGRGVNRDMFSAFWETAYCQFFEGTCLLTPNVMCMPLLICLRCLCWAGLYHMAF